jgi:NTE family protein
MADYRVGMIRAPRVPLAVAVAASSAFSPSLYASFMKLDAAAFDPSIAGTYDDPRFRTDAVLTDGGVTDPLAIETAWKGYDTILVSDGGRGMTAESRPVTDWAGHSRRLVELLGRHASDLRKRQVIEAFQAKVRGGALWDMQTAIGDSGLKDALECPAGHTAELANTPTRMARLSEPLQERLINWGYAACDAALRRDYLPSASPPANFPYPGSGV